MRTDLHHWFALWQRVNATGDGSAWHQRLTAAYGDPSRSYHNLEHLDECLTALDRAKGHDAVPNADAIELAIWFHDAVYDPRGSDNEERSTSLAREALVTAELQPSVIDDVCRLVMATKTHLAGDESDNAWIIDIDLAILGQPPSRFAGYEARIRQEYLWVPAAAYRSKRTEILSSFLARPRLYSTNYFNKQLESQARINLLGLIDHLRSTST